MDISDRAKQATDGLNDRDIEKLLREIGKRKQNIIKWLDDKILIDEYQIQTGKLWFKIQLAKDKNTTKKYLRAIRAGQSLTIKNKKEFAPFLSALTVGAKKHGWYDKTTSNDTSIQQLYDFAAMHKHDKTKIRELLDKISELRTQLINADIPKYTAKLKEFKALYEKDPLEKELQKFLESNLWIFGDLYTSQKSISFNFAQFPLFDNKLDFFLQRYDGFYDIVEIKRSGVSLFTGTDAALKREAPITKEVKDAISQIIDYLESAIMMKSALSEYNEQIKIHKPKGVIIIGRGNKRYDKQITTLNDYLNGIQVLTYDALYEKANKYLTSIQQST